MLDKFINLYIHIKSEYQITNDYPSYYAFMSDFSKLIVALSLEDREKLLGFIESSIDEANVNNTIFEYSFIINVTDNPIWFSRFVEYLNRSNKLIALRQKYCIYQQLASHLFRIPSAVTNNNRIAAWKYLKLILDEYKKYFSLRPIPLEQRNYNKALVITEQLLKVQHGPTKTALDRCYTLQQELGESVILLNTAELIPIDEGLHYFSMNIGSYIPELCNNESIQWNDASISYVQCDQMMPDMEEMNMLLDSIKDYSPGIVVLIGGSSLLAGLINEMVPVLTIGTSGLACTLTDYLVVDENINDNELDVLHEVGLEEENLIKGKFTFTLKPQTEKVTRVQFGIPEECFLLFTIGGRLDIELTDTFWSMLSRILSDHIHIVLIGKYSDEHVEYYQQIYTNLRGKIHNLGMCDDILSRVEICDLYINPIRQGGGTSCIDAMYKGKPVITTDYGDVAGIVGTNFSCSNYDNMSEIITQYAMDKEFYSYMSQEAKKVADVYLDSKTEFGRILNEYIKRQISKGDVYNG